MSNGQFVEILHEQIKRLFDVVIPEMVPANRQTEIDLMKVFVQNTDPMKFMNAVLKYLLPYSADIKNKQDTFFTQNKFNIFQDLPIPNDRIKQIGVWWEEGKIKPEDKEILWQYFNVFVTLGERYKKQN